MQVRRTRPAMRMHRLNPTPPVRFLPRKLQNPVVLLKDVSVRSTVAALTSLVVWVHCVRTLLVAWRGTVRAANAGVLPMAPGHTAFLSCLRPSLALLAWPCLPSPPRRSQEDTLMPCPPVSTSCRQRIRVAREPARRRVRLRRRQRAPSRCLFVHSEPPRGWHRPTRYPHTVHRRRARTAARDRRRLLLAARGQ